MKNVNLTLTPLNTKYLPHLFHFEQSNKLYFEQSCNPRPDSYINLDTFTAVQESFRNEMSKDSFLIFPLIAENQVVGRINLTDIKVEDNQIVADLGYRIGESFAGCGYATRAVRLLLEYVKTNNVCDILYAGAAIDNFGSQIVMLKNQFQFFEKVYNANGEFGPGAVYIECKRIVK